MQSLMSSSKLFLKTSWLLNFLLKLGVRACTQMFKEFLLVVTIKQIVGCH